MNGQQVRISERSVAELQHGMQGTVIDGPNDHGDLLVRIAPDACGIYCGDYWFPTDDLDEMNGESEQAAAARQEAR